MPRSVNPATRPGRMRQWYNRRQLAANINHVFLPDHTFEYNLAEESVYGEATKRNDEKWSDQRQFCVQPSSATLLLSERRHPVSATTRARPRIATRDGRYVNAFARVILDNAGLRDPLE